MAHIRSPRLTVTVIAVISILFAYILTLQPRHALADTFNNPAPTSAEIPATNPPPSPEPSPTAITTSAGPDPLATPGNIDPSAQNNNTTAHTADTNGTFPTTTINTHTSSSATTGNARASDNTSAGNATSGDSTVDTTAVATVGSYSQNPTIFSVDISDNKISDIQINPDTLLDTSPTLTTTYVPANSTIDLVNTVTSTAHSGNAAVTDNTTAGNATSGNANVSANIVDIVTSSLITKELFIGAVNIYASLIGDIVLPAQSLNSTFASDTISTGQANFATADSIEGTATTINNIFILTATSGQAQVMNNISAGSALSGNAKTNAQQLVLAGFHFIGTNLLLAIVNVTGTWNGHILGLNTGQGTAILGSDNIQQTFTSSSNRTGETHISNLITLTAQTGNATVSGNGSAGNATSGNAEANANAIDIISSNMQASGWIGILFINVFGIWNGNLLTATIVPHIVSSATPAITQEQNSFQSVAVSPTAPDSTIMYVRAFLSPIMPTQTNPSTTTIQPMPYRTQRHAQAVGVQQTHSLPLEGLVIGGIITSATVEGSVRKLRSHTSTKQNK